MTFPTSRQTDSSERVAETLDAMLTEMLAQLQAWRARINTNNSSSGEDAAAQYQRVTSVRTFVGAKVAADPAAMTAAYQRRFPNLSGFNPATEWAASKAAIDAFVTWFQGAWPKTAAGNPAFSSYHATTGELVDANLALSGGNKTTALARIDAILATFS